MLNQKDSIRFWSKVQISDDCWIWTACKDRLGYGRFYLVRPARLAHVIAYSDVYGPIPEGLEVCHDCDNPSCVRPDHLFLGTHAENFSDAVAKGRIPSGEKNHLSKLTEQEVIEIRRLRSQGIGRNELADRFGVTGNNIWCIVARKSWKHIP